MVDSLWSGVLAPMTAEAKSSAVFRSRPETVQDTIVITWSARPRGGAAEGSQASGLVPCVISLLEALAGKL